MVSGRGWQWLSGTRNYQFVPYESVGLRAAPKNSGRAGNKKTDEKTAEDGEKKKTEEEDNDRKEESEKTETETGEDDKKDEDTEQTSAKDSSQKEEDEKEEQEMEVDSSSCSGEKTEPLPEIVNVSDAIKEHTLYPKVSKPFSRLDCFLEKREKQYEIELKQKAAVEQIIARYKKQEEERKKLLAAQQKQKRRNGRKREGRGRR